MLHEKDKSKKEVIAQSMVRSVVKITTQLNRKIDAIHVEPSQRIRILRF